MTRQSEKADFRELTPTHQIFFTNRNDHMETTF